LTYDKSTVEPLNHTQRRGGENEMTEVGPQYLPAPYRYFKPLNRWVRTDHTGPSSHQSHWTVLEAVQAFASLRPLLLPSHRDSRRVQPTETLHHHNHLACSAIPACCCWCCACCCWWSAGVPRLLSWLLLVFIAVCVVGLLWLWKARGGGKPGGGGGARGENARQQSTPARLSPLG
jgi:hypothetical protein